MTLIVKEILAKTILSKSKIYPWVINPYTGCQHGCWYLLRPLYEKGNRAPGALG